MIGLLYLFLGLIAGWLVGMAMKGRGIGLAGYLVFGALGALIGGYLFQFFTIDTNGVIASLITASAGAILVLAIAGLINSH
jgi:uncharacterized membrane protein YeaQ/YmgE (transglycosylase-associated protein family)